MSTRGTVNSNRTGGLAPVKSVEHRGYSDRTGGLAPIKSVEHKGYKNTTRNMEISTQHLCTQCILLAAWESLILNTLLWAISTGLWKLTLTPVHIMPNWVTGEFENIKMVYFSVFSVSHMSACSCCIYVDISSNDCSCSYVHICSVIKNYLRLLKSIIPVILTPYPHSDLYCLISETDFYAG